uniref:Uncharacterized protein n=1 Tax=Arundo donax TaxID=35708 RepID=A0A0A9GLP3_ARUDO
MLVVFAHLADVQSWNNLQSFHCVRRSFCVAGNAQSTSRAEVFACLACVHYLNKSQSFYCIQQPCSPAAMAQGTSRVEVPSHFADVHSSNILEDDSWSSMSSNQK